MQLGELLKQRRRKTGFSAGEVADSAGVGRSYYFEIEQGKRANISLLMAERLSQVLKIPLKDLAAAALKAMPAGRTKAANGARSVSKRSKLAKGRASARK